MSQQQLLGLYKSILNDLSCHVDESNGFVSIVTGADMKPLLVKEKRLILPYNEALRSYNTSTQQAFHPLCESTVRGQSPVFEKLHALVAVRLHSALVLCMKALMQIAVDKNSHQRLTPKQMPLIQILAEADEKTLAALDSVISITDPLGSSRIISVYMHSQPKLDKAYRRACMVSFPILSEFAKSEADIYGKKMRKKDKDLIAALLLFILSDCDKPHNYSVGTNADVAPMFDCLMRAFIKVHRDLNTIIKMYKEFVPMADQFTAVLDWDGELGNTAFLSRQIPVLTGNEGNAEVNASGNGATVAENIVTAPVVNASPMQPVNFNGMGTQNLFTNTSANPPNVSLGVTASNGDKVNAANPAASADEVAHWSNVVAKNTMANTMLPQFAARGAPVNTPVFTNGVANTQPVWNGGMPPAWNGVPNPMMPMQMQQPHGVMNVSHLVAQAQQNQMMMQPAWMQPQMNPAMQWNGGMPMVPNPNMPTWLNNQPMQPQFNNMMGGQQPMQWGGVPQFQRRI